MTTPSRIRARASVTLRVVRAVLRSPALRRVELAFLTFNAIEDGTWVAILLYAYGSIGPASVGLVAVIQLVPAAIVAPLSASLGDRYPRDQVLFAGYVVMTVAYGSTWIGMAADVPPPLVVIAATLVGRQDLAPVLGGAALVSGLGLAALAAVSPVWAAPLIVVAGIGFASCDVIGRTILQRVTPDRVLARVFGALEGLALALVVLAVGVQGALVVAGLLLPAGIALSWLGLRTMDRGALVPVRALELLRAVEIFAPVPPPQLEWVARQARWVTFERGDAIISEGDIGDAYYVLESGVLRVTRYGELLRILSRPGDGVGEIALLRDVPRTATVTSDAVSVMLRLGRPTFLEAVTGHPQAHETAQRVVSALA